jgi:hypothetical protein
MFLKLETGMEINYEESLKKRGLYMSDMKEIKYCIVVQ